MSDIIKCSLCENTVYKGFKECVLHCDKNGFDVESAIDSFYDSLRNYISKNSKNARGEPIDERSVQSYLGDVQQKEKIFTKFHDIQFPKTFHGKHHNYYKLLSQLTGFEFWKCTFNFFKFHFEHLDMIFFECEFKEGLEIDFIFSPKNSFKNGQAQNKRLYDLNFSNCNFVKDVFLKFNNRNEFSFNDLLFSDCNFSNKNVTLQSASFDNTIFFFSEKCAGSNLNDIILNDIILSESATILVNCKDKLSMNNINILSSTLNGRVELNRVNFNAIIVKNSLMNNKFDVRFSEGDCFDASNSNFGKHTDFYNSKIINFQIKTCVIESFSAEECEFGIDKTKIANLCKNKDWLCGGKDKLCIKINPVTFEYATFKNISTFRGSEFNSGLCLDRANFKDQPNFLHCDIVEKNTTRETFRIIKNSFDKVGNNIEGNKYFAKEMRKYKEELNKSKFSQEWLVLFFNITISNFGQSYLRPLVLISVLSIVTTLLYQFEFPVSFFNFTHGLEWLPDLLNKFAKNITPISKFLMKKFEFISLVLYVVYASLIWQLIVAVKRHSKR